MYAAFLGSGEYCAFLGDYDLINKGGFLATVVRCYCNCFWADFVGIFDLFFYVMTLGGAGKFFWSSA